jgi:hypothetical protein
MADEKKRNGQRRMTASERRAAAAKDNNPFSTISAEKRRAERAVRTGRPAQSLTSSKSSNHALDQSMIADILAHPTKEVSEQELRQAYTYVVNDLRSMGILAASLIVLLFVLAQLLPK